MAGMVVATEVSVSTPIDPAVRQHVVDRIREFAGTTLGWEGLGICQSPIQGPAGNVEFLSYWRKPS